MLTQMKLFIDSLTWSFSKRLTESKWLYYFLGFKWTLTIVVIFICGQYAYFNDAWIILVVPVVILPKAIKHDFQRIKSLGKK